MSHAMPPHMMSTLGFVLVLAATMAGYHVGLSKGYAQGGVSRQFHIKSQARLKAQTFTISAPAAICIQANGKTEAGKAPSWIPYRPYNLAFSYKHDCDTEMKGLQSREPRSFRFRPLCHPTKEFQQSRVQRVSGKRK